MRKNQFSAWVGCLLLLWLVAASAAEPEVTAEEKRRILQRVERVLEKRVFAFGFEFERWEGLVAEQRDALDAATSHKDFATALQAALNGFGISHLAVSAPERSREIRQVRRSGLGVGFHLLDGERVVTRIARSSPAYAAGIRKGDVLLRMDGVPFAEALKEPYRKRSEVTVDYRRDGETRFATVRQFPYPPSDRPSLRWLDDEVAVLEVMSFSRRQYGLCKTTRLLRQARRARALILDLRGNHGGYVHHYLHLASLFRLNGGPVHHRVTRRNYRRAQRLSGRGDPDRETLLRVAKKGRAWLPMRRFRGPVVVLVDSYSASAADILPAALSERGEAVIVGTPTSGALLASRSTRLPLGYRMQFPCAEILTPDGRRMEGAGLVPDRELSVRETADDRKALQVALEEIERLLAEPGN